jgi:hypothetical protein
MGDVWAGANLTQSTETIFRWTICAAELADVGILRLGGGATHFHSGGASFASVGFAGYEVVGLVGSVI